MGTMNIRTKGLDIPFSEPEKKSIFGVKISDLTLDEAIDCLLNRLDRHHHSKIAFCNAHTANLAWNDSEFRNILKDFTIFPDGIGVDIGAKQLYGAAFIANLNGSEFVPTLLISSKKALRVALFGGAAGVAEKAAKKLQALTPQHSYNSVLNGFVDLEEQQSFLAQLKQSPVDILLVAMGNPKQENWIAQHITEEHATLAVGVGALFDFLSGQVLRAPVFVQHLRLEWLFRLLQEPKRLFRRYVLGIPLFLLRVALVKFGLRRF
jgi:exopolysaccharide biosynthesis WecB/TagA/CpsF family protein